MNWYYIEGKDRKGPVTEEQFQQLQAGGQITGATFVWHEGMADWKMYSEIAGADATVMASVAASQQAVVYGGGGGTLNRDLMQMAKESLNGRWGLGVGVTLLFIVVSIACEFFPLAPLLVSGPLTAGLAMVFLSVARRKEAGIGQLFDGFSRFGTAFCAYLLMAIFVLLWSLLLIIPGIIAAFAYSMTFFIIADDPSVGALDAISRSNEMMRGKKWKLFCLELRFIGWSILCIFTFGIGYLWLFPYMQTSMAHFYDDMRQ